MARSRRCAARYRSPPPARITVHFAAHVRADRITAVSEEEVQLGPGHPDTIAHHWMLEQERGS
jgi:hypothetical protein